MKRQRALTACVALVATSVLVAGCGGDDEKSDKADEGKIAGAEKSPSAKPSPTPSATAGQQDGPDLSLPKDVKIVADWAEPSGAEEAAVLRDARDFTIAFYRAITQQDVRDPAYLSYTYPGGNARRITEKNVRDHVAKKYSVSGTERLTRPSVEIVHKGSTAVVTYCADDTHFYTKDLKAGKPMLTTPSPDDHILFELGMSAVGHKGRWVVKELRADVGAQQCQ